MMFTTLFLSSVLLSGALGMKVPQCAHRSKVQVMSQKTGLPIVDKKGMPVYHKEKCGEPAVYVPLKGYRCRTHYLELMADGGIKCQKCEIKSNLVLYVEQEKKFLCPVHQPDGFVSTRGNQSVLRFDQNNTDGGENSKCLDCAKDGLDQTQVFFKDMHDHMVTKWFCKCQGNAVRCQRRFVPIDHRGIRGCCLPKGHDGRCQTMQEEGVVTRKFGVTEKKFDRVTPTGRGWERESPSGFVKAELAQNLGEELGRMYQDLASTFETLKNPKTGDDKSKLFEKAGKQWLKINLFHNKIRTKCRTGVSVNDLDRELYIKALHDAYISVPACYRFAKVQIYQNNPEAFPRDVEGYRATRFSMMLDFPADPQVKLETVKLLRGRMQTICTNFEEESKRIKELIRSKGHRTKPFRDILKKFRANRFEQLVRAFFKVRAEFSEDQETNLRQFNAELNLSIDGLKKEVKQQLDKLGIQDAFSLNIDEL